MGNRYKPMSILLPRFDVVGSLGLYRNISFCVQTPWVAVIEVVDQIS
jgi:hypothetical protein